jgi:nitrite reductase/ring-hydroxylating ferredoxin subunit
MTHRTRPTDQPESDVCRRTVLRGVAVGGLALPLLAACGGGDAASDADSTPRSSASGSPTSGTKSSGGSAGDGLAAADVPVGGGTILKDEKVVVTQPTKGEFKAFTAICTHQGCTVGSVTGGEIVCPCHDSHFSITDGSALSGPASAPLAAKKVSVTGGRISVT